MYIIYHNPRCSKSRQSLQVLEEAGVDFEVKNYMEDGLTKGDILTVKDALGVEVIEFTRTKEAAFKEKGLTKDSSEDEIIAGMLGEPKLFERPVILKNGKAVIGRPVENTINLVNK